MVTARREFDANMDTVPAMLAFVEELTAGFPTKAAYDVRLVCEEILVNIASYAYPGRDGQLAVLWEDDTGGRRVRIRFEDSGVPFDPLQKEAPDLDQPAAQRPIGGLGIMMVHKRMDTVEYQYQDGKNKLTVSKGY